MQLDIDWNFIVKLLISSGVAAGLLKWAAPVLFKQAIKDTINDLYEQVDSHEERITKNELGVTSHSHQMTKLQASVTIIETKMDVLFRIERHLEKIDGNVTDLTKTVYRMQGRVDHA